MRSITRHIEISEVEFASELIELSELVDRYLSKRESSMTYEEANKLLDNLQQIQASFHLMAKIDDGILGKKIIGTGSILFYQRVNGEIFGQIEDVVVHPDFRGNGVGAKLVQHLLLEAKIKNCYKVVLSCSSENKKFYLNLGFKESQNHMRISIGK